MQEKYDAAAVELAEQKSWEDNLVHRASEDTDRPKYYCLSMLPYPSGKLHMGHVRNYSIGDALSRYRRMIGYNVLQPMGWDAFGMPAENAAMQNHVAPGKWTEENIAYMKKQLQRLGFSIDWQREFATCHPDYYRWEQWLFTRLYQKGYIYQKKGVVNWDPIEQTVLANEQVVEGRGWRSGALVEKREIPMYYMNISAYAEELLEELEQMPGWPEQVKLMQKNWIGKSIGVRFYFPYQIAGRNEQLWVFTTRPDTIMGVTYCAIAPDHPLATELASSNLQLADFISSCRQGGVSEAEIAAAEKRGMDTGMFVQHPLTGENIPLWLANYVLMSYGEGAVMAVPAHDERDFAFANKYNLPIKQVMQVANEHYDTKLWQEWYADKQRSLTINSGKFAGLSSSAAIEAVANELSYRGFGEKKTLFRLRDWGISRQRYWGCPIPIIHCADCGAVPVPDQQLPVVLPNVDEITNSGSPLTRMPEFYQVSCPQCGKPARRETDTMDTFIESSWYYFRYCCADNQQAMLDQRVNYWCAGGIDQYIGGIEHAILHLLYSRYFTRVLRDIGLFGDMALSEPFKNLLTQGMVVAPTYYRLADNQQKIWFNPAEVEIRTDDKGHPLGAILKSDRQKVEIGNSEKMSKSKNNGVDPQTIIEQYGADTARLFILFASPPEQSLEWSDSGVEGAHRFLRRLWRICYEFNQRSFTESTSESSEQFTPPQLELRRKLHQTIGKVRSDYEKRLQFNTVIAAVMECLNSYERTNCQGSKGYLLAEEIIANTLLILFPIVPHICAKLYAELFNGADIHQVNFPVVDEKALAQEELQLMLQVNGKLRGKITVAASATAAEIEQLAKNDPVALKHTSGLPIKKIIVIPQRIVNIVV